MNRLSRTNRGWLVIVAVMIAMTAFAATHEDKMQDTQSQAEQKAHEHSEAMKDTADTMTKDHTETMKEHAGKMKEHKGKTMQQCNIAGRSGSLQSADDILAQNVHNRQGQKLGSVEELILNDSRQAIDYVVISADNKLYPVPWTAFEPGSETYTLDISAADLKKAPTVSALSSDQFKDSALRDKSHEYYKQQMTSAQEKGMGQRVVDWAQEQAAEIYRDEPAGMSYSANQILGYEVQNRQGEDIGELKDIVFDVREGNLAYGLISFGGIMGIGSKTAAVPWESIQLESTREIAQLQADESGLRNAVLPDGDLQQLSEPTFARRVHQNFNQEPYWEVFGFVAPTGAQDMSMAAWQAGSDFNKNFNPDTVETMQGTIKQVSSFTPAKQAAEGLKLKVKTADGRTMTVYAGPHDHYKQQSLQFSKDDQVTITGSRTTVDNKNVIMATRIQKDGKTLNLRDAQGNPAWKSDAMQDQSDRQQQTDDKTKMKEDTPPRYY